MTPTEPTSSSSVANIFHSSLAKLHIVDSQGTYLRLPEWCNYFMQIGMLASASRRNGIRWVCGLSVASKAFAAAFLAAGVTTFLLATKQFTDIQIANHLGELRKLPHGTPLVYRKKNNVYMKCVFDGFEDDGPEQLIRILRSEKGNLTGWVPPQMALGLEQINTNTSFMNRTHTGRKIIAEDDYQFLCTFLGKQKADDLLVFSRLDCNVIGTTSAFHDEVNAANVAVFQGDLNPRCSSLRNLLGIRDELFGTSAMRTMLTSSVDSEPGRHILRAPVTIFNGANAYLKCSSLHKHSNCIIVLDRTEPKYPDAVLKLNQNFIQNRADNQQDIDVPRPPTGIEIIHFHEQCE